MEPMQFDEMYSTGSAALSGEEIMPRVRPLWYKDFAKQDISPPSWIVEKFIPDESITILSALPAQFKTWLAFDIAIQVALGKPLFGQFEAKQTNVLIVDEESGPGRLRERLQMLGVTDEAPIAIASYSGFKLTEESANWLIAYCEAQSIGLIIFDSLTRLHDADENTAKEMSVVMGNFKRLAQAGLAVLLIHHDRKPGPNKNDGANAMRGSVEILAACDAQISLKRSGNIVTVTQNKNRDAEDLPPFSLELCNDGERWWFEYVGNVPKRIGKAERTDDAIRELLADDGPLFQEQIIDGLKTIEGVGGEKMIASRLKALLGTEELVRTVGASGKHVYELKPEQLNE